MYSFSRLRSFSSFADNAFPGSLPA
eukprot:COSAG02_NODE_69963_length_197_cov_167.775510_1_plen_24_part_01